MNAYLPQASLDLGLDRKGVRALKQTHQSQQLPTSGSRKLVTASGLQTSKYNQSPKILGL